MIGRRCKDREVLSLPVLIGRGLEGMNCRGSCMELAPWLGVAGKGF